MDIPKHIQIETINGACSARCVMCTINDWQRPPQIMSMETFLKILNKFVPIRDHIEFVTLHGFGEPLLDSTLPQKVALAKEMGFSGVGFASNCTHLKKEKSLQLLQSNLDTLICSIDGITKLTHETIRVGTVFEKVVQNTLDFIELRNSGDYKTRVLIRFINQTQNKHEWLAFKDFWVSKIRPDKRDDVIKFDVHNWANFLEEYDEKDTLMPITESAMCPDPFERMVVNTSGQVALCCVDTDADFYNLGNIFQVDSPLDIYNNEIFQEHRRAFRQGQVGSLKYCSKCSIPRSRKFKDIPSG